MQKFSKEELQTQADKFMQAHNVDSFYATEDGNFFHPKDKGLADDHNRQNVKGEVITFLIPVPSPQVEKGEEIKIDPANAVPEVIISTHISEDVERQGAPAPKKDKK